MCCLLLCKCLKVAWGYKRDGHAWYDTRCRKTIVSIHSQSCLRNGILFAQLVISAEKRILNLATLKMRMKEKLRTINNHYVFWLFQAWKATLKTFLHLSGICRGKWHLCTQWQEPVSWWNWNWHRENFILSGYRILTSTEKILICQVTELELV